MASQRSFLMTSPLFCEEPQSFDTQSVESVFEIRWQLSARWAIHEWPHECTKWCRSNHALASQRSFTWLCSFRTWSAGGPAPTGKPQKTLSSLRVLLKTRLLHKDRSQWQGSLRLCERSKKEILWVKTFNLFHYLPGHWLDTEKPNKTFTENHFFYR